MARKKLVRFAELEKMSNVVDGRRCQPDWLQTAFEPDRPLLLELGCGRGEYTLALARSRPHSGVVGVDRNGARLWKGARRALDEGIENAIFLRSLVEALPEQVPEGRVSEIWLPFPDPLPKKRQAKHRLISPRFLRLYRRLLAPSAVLHLKTDDRDVVDNAVEALRVVGGRVLQRHDDLWPDGPPDALIGVETTYERRYRAEGRPIHYLEFRLD